ncbi:MAG TPA: TauD/TfdA family dioxygenase [Pararhodobacter sp.]|uniref:TauD/TfdA dioxygenase family protein n=1 Tax=Pararhodobacter sp. TaxID=2127056 RepID=UPI002BE407AE|nr:TauD/TfdA family dioxygenase [Pararhodobacter sp.]HPD93427.1 TauD/TfdA family dioxygenase [Pararhodobacter sp.]
MQIRRLTGTIGAEILDADLGRDDDAAAIRAAFVTHSVVVIRDQRLTPEDHLAFARRFGPINVNRFFAAHPEHREIALVLKEPDQTGAIGEEWHTDHAYDSAPAMGSILHAIETPPYGGDTVFASMGAAYEGLSERFRAMIAGLSAWHSSRHVFGDTQKDTDSVRSGRVGNAAAATQDSLHPVVIRHPLSGRKGLFVNPQFTTRIDGLLPLESESVLGALYRHCQKPEFQCRVSWRAGDVTLWDNRATWHKAINDYQGHRRLMHRVTVEGVPLTAA